MSESVSFSFIWSKKIEKEVEGGASFKDLDVTAERDRQRARLVLHLHLGFQLRPFHIEE